MNEYEVKKLPEGPSPPIADSQIIQGITPCCLNAMLYTEIRGAADFFFAQKLLRHIVRTVPPLLGLTTPIPKDLFLLNCTGQEINVIISTVDFWNEGFSPRANHPCG